VDSIFSLKALIQYRKACCPLLVVTATILLALFLISDLLVLGSGQMGFLRREIWVAQVVSLVTCFSDCEKCH